MWREENDALYRKFEFENFEQAIEFINKVAELANQYDHHPKILNEYNKVELWLSTHSAGNKVTDKDRKLAKAIDELSTTG